MDGGGYSQAIKVYQKKKVGRSQSTRVVSDSKIKEDPYLIESAVRR